MTTKPRSKHRRPQRKLVHIENFHDPARFQREVGQRLRAAREEADVTETAAAMLMGYTQPSNLSAVESGARPATAPLLVKAAKIYGTTTDYLLGLTDDMDRDPAAGLARHITGRVSADVRQLVSAISQTSVALARGLLPSMGDGARLAAAALDLVKAMRDLESAGQPSSDRAHNAAARTESLAQAYVQQIGRARRAMAVKLPTATEAQKSGAPEQLTIGALELDIDDETATLF